MKSHFVPGPLHMFTRKLTDKGISISDNSISSPYHLVPHAKVKIEARLILTEPQKFQGYCDNWCFTVIYSWTPGCATPYTPDIGSLCFWYLQRPIETSFHRKGYKFPQGEAVEGQLQCNRLRFYYNFIFMKNLWTSRDYFCILPAFIFKWDFEFSDFKWVFVFSDVIIAHSNRLRRGVNYLVD